MSKALQGPCCTPSLHDDPMKKIQACFSDTYSADTPTASMRKLAPVARAAQSAGYVEIHDPGMVGHDLLFGLHSPGYVRAFLSGKGPLVDSQGWHWTPEIRDGVLAMNAGQIQAAWLALEHGIAANVAQGFHHARPEHGAGFCTFNGLALVAREFPEKRVFVLDCDEHCGDGTAEFTKTIPNLFNFSINGTNWRMHESTTSVCRHLAPVRLDFTPYREALEEAFRTASEWKADLIIYQAGADPHVDDPLGSESMTTEQLLERDRMVFAHFHRAGIPLFFVLAGGYQEPIEEKLVPLHLITFRAAFEEYCAEARKA